MLAGQKRKRSMSITDAMTRSKEQFNIARYTFAVYKPYAVTAMAVDLKAALCAVARENGQIELWRIPSWTMLFSIPPKTGTGFGFCLRRIKNNSHNLHRRDDSKPALFWQKLALDQLEWQYCGLEPVFPPSTSFDLSFFRVFCAKMEPKIGSSE